MVVMNNLGLLLAGIFATPVTTKIIAGFFTISNAPFSLRIYGTDATPNKNFTENGGSFAQVGEGSTPASRSDFNIQTPFANGGIEDNQKSTNGFGYNSGLGKITIATQIAPTVGTGTITEVVKINTLKTETGAIEQFLWLRAVISGKFFAIGQSIDLSHEVTI